jgi:acyl dehydratase
VDPRRSRARETAKPGPQTIAHGYLTLSLLGALGQEIGAVPENTQAAINYGLDTVRFLAPVITGVRIRLRTVMISIEVKGPGRYLMKALNTVEIEGEEKPALIAETLVMLYERRQKKVISSDGSSVRQAHGSP